MVVPSLLSRQLADSESKADLEPECKIRHSLTSSKSGQITFNIHKLNNKYLTPAFGGQIIPANNGNAVWRLQLNFNFEKE